jgi:hypothetical protein
MAGRPMQLRIAKTEKRIAAETKKLNAYQEALVRFDDRIREYNELHSSIENGKAVFSGKDEVFALYKTLGSLCHQPGYHLDEITPSVEEVIQFLREWARSDSTITIPIRIKAEADYTLLADLIKAVEQSEYFNRLTFCRLRGSDKLYPQCALDLTFIAGLDNRLEMFDLE